MDISVIIVNYKTAKETSAAIRSCLEEGSQLTFEVIVVDNNSEDDSYEDLVKEFGKDKKVVLIHNSTNEGFSKAVNVGLKRSRGDYKLLLNSDTKLAKKTFSKLISFAKSDEKIGVVGTKLVLPDGSIQNSCFNFPTIQNAIKEYWLGLKGRYSPFYKNSTSEVDAVVGASFLITPKAFASVGFFDERFFMYFEDLDYCKRVKEMGLKVIYYPEIEIFHYHGLSGKNIVEQSNQWRRLVPSSIIYHGRLRHNIINFILWSSQVFKRIIS